MNKLYPITGHEDPEGKQRCRATFSLTSEPDLGGCSTPVPSDVPPKETRYTLHRRLGGNEMYLDEIQQHTGHSV